LNFPDSGRSVSQTAQAVNSVRRQNDDLADFQRTDNQVDDGRRYFPGFYLQMSH
jgi:hypothetical protein